MSIPKYQELMLPFLEVLSDKKSHRIGEIVEILAKKFNLTEEEILEEIPTGGRRFAGRVGWARTYLKMAKIIDSPHRGCFIINDRGFQTLKERPENILQYLKQYDEFLDFEKRSKKENFVKDHNDNNYNNETETPDEMLERAQKIYLNNLKNEMLTRLKQVEPIKFEKIVLILMEKMNYGVGSMTKISHDGGIDGIVYEDELGLEKIYLQAKRYTENKVTEKDMIHFIGALSRSKVNKGVFITTSNYFDSAIKAAHDARENIKLINGEKLVELMIKYNVGVELKAQIEIKKIDEDFFSDEE